MDKLNLRTRLLRLLGSTSVLAGVAAGTWACSSEDPGSDGTPSGGTGGTNTNGASGGSAMAAGTIGTALGGASGAAPGGALAGSPGGAAPSGDSGMSGAGQSGGANMGGALQSGGSNTGGASDSGGAATAGTTGGTTPSGGRFAGAAAGGTCYVTPKCFSLADAWALAIVDGSAGAAGAPANACPAGNQMRHGVCESYSNATFDAGQCCYEYFSGTCCGRPFVVGDMQRLAPIARRADWSSALESSGDVALEAGARRALADAWRRDAQLEHASVASFARFALELLAIGAPAALVEGAQRAMGDEIQHARLCFSLATRYAGEALGPGVLDLEGSLDGGTLAEMAASTVLEGCVGETLAALEAGERFALATDLAARAALQVIRDDEAAHAELAWAFARWALRTGGDVVRRAVEAAFARARSRIDALVVEPMEAVDVSAWHAHGQLTPAERVACQRAAFDAVIAPCRDALLTPAPSPGDAAFA